MYLEQTPTYYRAGRIIVETTEIESTLHHMCIDSCIALHWAVSYPQQVSYLWWASLWSILTLINLWKREGPLSRVSYYPYWPTATSIISKIWKCYCNPLLTGQKITHIISNWGNGLLGQILWCSAWIRSHRGISQWLYHREWHCSHVLSRLCSALHQQSFCMLDLHMGTFQPFSG